MTPLSRWDEARLEIRRVIIDFLERRGFSGLDDRVRLETPTEKGHGDLTTSFALKIAQTTKMAPRALLEELIREWPETDSVDALNLAGPGFLNVSLKTEWLAEVVSQVTANPEGYGDSGVGQGQKVLLEFVSANPTGPMVIVNGRAAAVGDTLARVMNAAGFHADREFYVNDAGKQIESFGHAIHLRLRELDGEEVERNWPEGVYPGDYVKELARQFRERPRDVAEDDHVALGAWGAERMRASHEVALKRFGVVFERWFSEASLRLQHGPEEVVERLDSRGYMAERDGAQWFLSTRFGDDKDRVMVRSDGTYTYVVPDAAYHAGKFDRGYDYVIDLLGPDHHGYVARMRAVVEALGYRPDRLEIMIIQLVRLLRGGELVRMSKRGGSIIELDELIEEAGVDPARYFFLERAPETPMDFDLDLAKLKGSDNPVYYVQYAGARIQSILRQWHESGLPPAPLDLTVLTEPLERELLIHLARFPEVVARVALERAPQHLPRFLTELAQSFHSFYRQHRVLEGDAATRQARIALSEAVLAVLRRGLGLLGISQPDEM